MIDMTYRQFLLLFAMVCNRHPDQMAQNGPNRILAFKKIGLFSVYGQVWSGAF